MRAIAGSDHCRWVSTPRWRRTSAKVTSIDQRRTNQRRMSSGSASRSVQRKACGSSSPAGSRTKHIADGNAAAGMVPHGGGRDDLDHPFAAAIPSSHQQTPPARLRIGQALLQCGLTLADDRRASGFAGHALWRWFV